MAMTEADDKALRAFLLKDCGFKDPEILNATWADLLRADVYETIESEYRYAVNEVKLAIENVAPAKLPIEIISKLVRYANVAKLVSGITAWMMLNKGIYKPTDPLAAVEGLDSVNLISLRAHVSVNPQQVRGAGPVPAGYGSWAECLTTHIDKILAQRRESGST